MWEATVENQVVVAYVLQLLDRLSVARELVAQNIRMAQENGKVYDRYARLRIFSVGDQVMVLRPARKHKL